jgi:hypothetical protein
MDNPEKLAKWDIQDEDKQSKNTLSLLVEENDKLSNFITYCCVEYTSPEPDSNSQRTDNIIVLLTMNGLVL